MPSVPQSVSGVSVPGVPSPRVSWSAQPGVPNPRVSLEDGDVRSTIICLLLFFVVGVFMSVDSQVQLPITPFRRSSSCRMCDLEQNLQRTGPPFALEIE